MLIKEIFDWFNKISTHVTNTFCMWFKNNANFPVQGINQDCQRGDISFSWDHKGLEQPK